MKPSNYELWGQIPGQSESVIIRKHYIHELTNPREVIYQGKAPVMKEIGPFNYQEYQTFDKY